MAKSQLPIDKSPSDEITSLADALWDIVEKERDFSDFLCSLIATDIPEKWQTHNANEKLFMRQLHYQLKKLTEEKRGEYSMSFSLIEGGEEEKNNMANFLKNYPIIAEIFETHLPFLQRKFLATEKPPINTPPNPMSAASIRSNILHDYTLQDKLRGILESPAKFQNEPGTIEYNILEIFNKLPEEKRAHCYLHLRNHSLNAQFLLDNEIENTIKELHPWLEKIQQIELLNDTLSNRMKNITSTELPKRKESVSYYENGKLLFTLETPYQTPEETKEQANKLATEIRALDGASFSLLNLYNNSVLRSIVIEPVAPGVNPPTVPVTVTEYNYGLNFNTRALADFLEKDPRSRHYIANYLQALNIVQKLLSHEKLDLTPLELSSNTTLQSLITQPHHQEIYTQGTEALSSYVIQPFFIEFLAIKPEVRNSIENYERTLPTAPSNVVSSNITTSHRSTARLSAFANPKEQPVLQSQNIKPLSTLLLSIAENPEKVKSHVQPESDYDKAIDSIKTAYTQLSENDQKNYREAMATLKPELFLGSHKEFAETLNRLHDSLEDLAEYFPNSRKSLSASPSSIVRDSTADGPTIRPDTPRGYSF